MQNVKDIIAACEKTGGAVSYIGYTALGHRIPMITKGCGKERILIVAGVHAREHITVPLVLALMTQYKGKFAVDCVPVLNIDGVLLAKNGLNALPLRINERQNLIKINGGKTDFSLWKANARAVDINVNFDAGWGEGKGNALLPAPESYIGRCPASEPETQSIVRLLSERNYVLVAAYHSKGEEVYYGFRDNKKYQEEARIFANSLNYALKETPESAGGLKDYFTCKTGRLGLTVEVGSDLLPHPYPESELPNLIKRHSGSVELLTEIARGLWTKYNTT